MRSRRGALFLPLSLLPLLNLKLGQAAGLLPGLLPLLNLGRAAGRLPLLTLPTATFAALQDRQADFHLERKKFVDVIK